MGEPLRLFGDLLLRVTSGREVAQQTPTLGLIELGGWAQEVVGLLRSGGPGPAQVEQLFLGVTHQRHADFASAPTLAAKASHDLLQCLVEFLSRERQGRGRERALRAEACEEVEEFL